MCFDQVIPITPKHSLLDNHDLTHDPIHDSMGIINKISLIKRDLRVSTTMLVITKPNFNLTLTLDNNFNTNPEITVTTQTIRETGRPLRRIARRRVAKNIKRWCT